VIVRMEILNVALIHIDGKNFVSTERRVVQRVVSESGFDTLHICE
jgi:hypothetical protein